MAFGVSEAEARAFVGEAPELKPFRVWRQNWEAWRAFQALGTSWRYIPLGPPTGIERREICATLELMGVKRRQWPRLFEQLRVMEDEALAVLNERE